MSASVSVSSLSEDEAGGPSMVLRRWTFSRARPDRANQDIDGNRDQHPHSDDGSFALRRGGTTAPAGDSLDVFDYSINDSLATDYGDYTSPYDVATPSDVSDSSVTVGSTGNDGPSDDSVFSASYNHMVQSFLFPSIRPRIDAYEKEGTPSRNKSDVEAPAEASTSKAVTLGDVALQTPDSKTTQHKENTSPTTTAPPTPQSKSSSVPPPSRTRVCGLPLPFMVCLALIIFLGSVTVAVTAGILSRNADDDSSTSEGISPEFENQLFPTIGPVDVPSPSMSPTMQPISTALTATPVPSSDPAEEDLQPTSSPSVFPLEVCGGDDDTTTFFFFEAQRTCAWFRYVNIFLPCQRFFSVPRSQKSMTWNRPLSHIP